MLIASMRPTCCNCYYVQCVVHAIACIAACESRQVTTLSATVQKLAKTRTAESTPVIDERRAPRLRPRAMRIRITVEISTVRVDRDSEGELGENQLANNAKAHMQGERGRESRENTVTLLYPRIAHNTATRRYGDVDIKQSRGGHGEATTNALTQLMQVTCA